MSRLTAPFSPLLSLSLSFAWLDISCQIGHPFFSFSFLSFFLFPSPQIFLYNTSFKNLSSSPVPFHTCTALLLACSSLLLTQSFSIVSRAFLGLLCLLKRAVSFVVFLTYICMKLLCLIILQNRVSVLVNANFQF